MPLIPECPHRFLPSLVFGPFPASSPGARQVSPGGGEGAVTATASGNPDDAPSICTGMGKNIWTTSVQGLTAGQAVNSPSRGDAAWGAGHPGRFPSPFSDELRWEGENLPAARDPGGSTCQGSPGSRRYRLQHVAWEAVSWLRAPKLIIRVPAHGLRLYQRRGASSEQSTAPPVHPTALSAVPSWMQEHPAVGALGSPWCHQSKLWRGLERSVDSPGGWGPGGRGPGRRGC